jgi:lysophospholipase L1-like esterase
MKAWRPYIMLLICCAAAWAADTEDNQAMNEQRDGALVIMGASYARGWNPGELGGRECINKGVDGEQSHEVRARFERDVLALQPRSVIIWGYINDIHRSDRADMERTKERARRSFIEMVDLARANGIEPIVATEVTIRNKDSWKELIAAMIGRLLGKESYQDYVNSQVLELNEWLTQYAEQNALLLLDLQPLLSDQNGRRKREYATEDGSHISPAGYEVLTSHFGKILESHLRRE